ncbi:AI-2E family transporter [Scatolibacter rhodanostii]|uniref:AI-2E family transporter n=1 Tax=Scatolibacter rhodanostii TaxID=2014781 RepID=UPI000C07176A|nr:AI-2E family transporter [Scatolibacter rhodanostii]
MFQLNKDNMKKILFIISFGLILFWVLSHTSVVVSVITNLLTILQPFLLGLSLAFILNVLLRPIEKLWDWIASKFVKSHKKKKPLVSSKQMTATQQTKAVSQSLAKKESSVAWHQKIKRPVCLLLSTTIIVGGIFVIIFMILPEIQHTAANIVQMFPQYMERIEIWWKQLSEFLAPHAIVLPEPESLLNELRTTLTNLLSESGQGFFNKTINITASIFSGAFSVVLGFVLAFYILLQKETLGRQIRKVLSAFLPSEKVNRIIGFSDLTSRTFTNFVTGQLVEAIIIGLLCFIGMSVFSMPYAPAISVLVGFTALIPVFGAFFGTIIGAFLILMVDPIKALAFIIFIVVLQQLEGDFIYPKVVGKSVGLPGLWVLTAVTIGSRAFGFLGMLVSVPVCSVLYTMLKYTVNHHSKQKQENELEV